MQTINKEEGIDYIVSSEYKRKSALAEKVLYFGAGPDAVYAYTYFRSDVDGFLVSNRFNNPKTLFDKPVLIFEDFEKDMRCKILVIITHDYPQIPHIRELLNEAGFTLNISYRYAFEVESVWETEYIKQLYGGHTSTQFQLRKKYQKKKS